MYAIGESAEALINRADALLYEAKQTKDCVRVEKKDPNYQDLVSSEED